jgi:hypothetical protein
MHKIYFYKIIYINLLQMIKKILVLLIDFHYIKKFRFNLLLVLVFVICVVGCRNVADKNVKDLTSVEKTTTGVDLSFLEMEDGAYVIPWKYLLRLQMDSSYNEQMAMVVELPVFNDTLKALEGKQVIVEGYYIPATETKDNQIVILSAFPFAECFYCGKAGIESVIDVLSVKPLPRMKTDTKTRIRGRFRLNAENFDYLVFVLEESSLLEKD